VTLASTARPVATPLWVGRAARGCALRCLRVSIRTKARHCSRRPRSA